MKDNKYLINEMFYKNSSCVKLCLVPYLIYFNYVKIILMEVMNNRVIELKNAICSLHMRLIGLISK